MWLKINGSACSVGGVWRDGLATVLSRRFNNGKASAGKQEGACIQLFEIALHHTPGQTSYVAATDTLSPTNLYFLTIVVQSIPL